MIPFLILINGRVFRRLADPKATCCLSLLPDHPPSAPLLYSIPAVGWRGPCCGLCPGYALFQGLSPSHHCLPALFPINSWALLEPFLKPGSPSAGPLPSSPHTAFSAQDTSVRNDRYFDSSSGLYVRTRVLVIFFTDVFQTAAQYSLGELQ